MATPTLCQAFRCTSFPVPGGELCGYHIELEEDGETIRRKKPKPEPKPTPTPPTPTRKTRGQALAIIQEIQAQRVARKGPLCYWKSKKGKLCFRQGAVLTDSGWLCRFHMPKEPR